MFNNFLGLQFEWISPRLQEDFWHFSSEKFLIVFGAGIQNIFKVSSAIWLEKSFPLSPGKNPQEGGVDIGSLPEHRSSGKPASLYSLSLS